MASEIQREQVVAIAADLSARYATPFEDGWFKDGQATVVEGAHEDSECPWIISWEECPNPEWTQEIDLLKEVCQAHAPGFFVEPVNHLAVAFWPV